MRRSRHPAAAKTYLAHMEGVVTEASDDSGERMRQVRVDEKLHVSQRVGRG